MMIFIVICIVGICFVLFSGDSNSSELNMQCYSCGHYFNEKDVHYESKNSMRPSDDDDDDDDEFENELYEKECPNCYSDDIAYN